MDFVLCYSLYSKLSRFKKKILNICEFRKVHSRYTYLFFSFAEKKKKKKSGTRIVGWAIKRFEIWGSFQGFVQRMEELRPMPVGRKQAQSIFENQPNVYCIVNPLISGCN